MGWYLDGRVSAVVGTHTHIQTSDERVLPNGTGYITDVGMTGYYDGILGINRDEVIEIYHKHHNVMLCRMMEEVFYLVLL